MDELDGLDFLDFLDTTDDPETLAMPKADDTKIIAKNKVQVKKTIDAHFLKRLKSEAYLEEQLDWHFEDGASYHCISFGDVDSLSYLRFILKQQPLEYCLLSTWCMAHEDIDEISDWIDRGLIKHIDFYVGEIFSGGYRGVYDKCVKVAKDNGGRVCVFRNHSKVIAGFGERFNFAIESSANINTNPRTEQTCITVNTGLAQYYKDFYDGISPFNKEFKDWTKYDLRGWDDGKERKAKNRNIDSGV